MTVEKKRQPGQKPCKRASSTVHSANEYNNKVISSQGFDLVSRTDFSKPIQAYGKP